MTRCCSSVCSRGVAHLKGKLAVRGFDGCLALGLPNMQCGSANMDHPPGVSVLKVCYLDTACGLLR